MKNQVEKTISGLQANNFTVHYCENREEALEKTMSLIPIGATVGFGGSLTLEQVGIMADLRKRDDIDLLDRDAAVDANDMARICHEARMADVFLTSANAITETGMLVNKDGRGNRLSALVWGPKKIIVVAGTNKIVPDLKAAIERIENHAAPQNAMRLNRKTPCVKTGKCENCNSPERICRTTVITEKPYPEWIELVLVEEELGL
jgi:L-lactate utilization protein LutB